MKPEEKNETDSSDTHSEYLIAILERVMKEPGDDAEPVIIASEEEPIPKDIEPECSYSDALDADMKSSLLMIQHFCQVHQCRRYSSKYCACCQGNLDRVHLDLEHHINRTAIDAILKETELPLTENKTHDTES